jgi:hypothetical protein
VTILLGKVEEMRPLRRARHRWVDNIKTIFKIIGWKGEY